MTSVQRQLAITRRPATPADKPLLRSLFADAHLELTALPTDTRFVLIDMQFRAQRHTYATAHPNAANEIVVADDKPVGRVLVDHSGEITRVVDISVSLGYRRLGIAGGVLAEIVHGADAANRHIELTVWSGNRPAVALVENAGFAPVADEAGYVTFDRAPVPA
jgi:ribosomal protein S18 acetylase RimI-like enzyme